MMLGFNFCKYNYDLSLYCAGPKVNKQQTKQNKKAKAEACANSGPRKAPNTPDPVQGSISSHDPHVTHVSFCLEAHS